MDLITYYSRKTCFGRLCYLFVVSTLFKVVDIRMISHACCQAIHVRVAEAYEMTSNNDVDKVSGHVTGTTWSMEG